MKWSTVTQTVEFMTELEFQALLIVEPLHRVCCEGLLLEDGVVLTPPFWFDLGSSPGASPLISCTNVRLAEVIAPVQSLIRQGVLLLVHHGLQDIDEDIHNTLRRNKGKVSGQSVNQVEVCILIDISQAVFLPKLISQSLPEIKICLNWIK